MKTNDMRISYISGGRSAIVAVFAAVALGVVHCQASLTSGLEGYWQFNGDGNDSSGNNRDLTLQGGIGFAPGLIGGALAFTGDPSKYAERTVDDQVFDFGSHDFTIQAWVNYNPTSYHQIIVEKFYGGSGPGWTLSKIGNDYFQFYPAGDGAYTSISLYSWHQVVVRRSGGTIDLFFDNNSNASWPVGAGYAFADTGNGLLVGRRNLNDGRPPEWFSMSGKMDELAIWSRSLSGPEISALWNNGNGMNIVPEPSTVLAGLSALGMLGLFGWRNRK